MYIQNLIEIHPFILKILGKNIFMDGRMHEWVLKWFRGYNTPPLFVWRGIKCVDPGSVLFAQIYLSQTLNFYYKTCCYLSQSVSQGFHHDNTVVIKLCLKPRIQHVMRKPVYAIREQQRCRSACAFVQSDQRLCCSLSGAV